MKVIVTGASRGIGRGIASFLAMDGFEVGLLARSGDLLEDLRGSLEEEGCRCFSVACDLRSAGVYRHSSVLSEGWACRPKHKI